MGTASIWRYQTRATWRSMASQFTLVIALLAYSRAGEGQGRPPAPNRGTPSIPVDLGSGVIVGVLPFDEPFLLAGLPSATLQSLRVVYGDDKFVTRDSCTAGWVGTKAKEGATASASSDTVRAVAAWARRQQSTDSFRVRIGALPPNRDFGFCFSTVSKLSAEDSTRFVNAVRGAIQQRARQWVQATMVLNSVPDDSLRALARELRNTLHEQVGDRFVLTIPAFSILSDAPETVAIGRAFASFTNANCDRLRLARQLQLQAIVDSSLLKALADSSSLQKLRTTLCPGASANPVGAEAVTVASTLHKIVRSNLIAPFVRGVLRIPDPRLPPARIRLVADALTRLRSTTAGDLGDVAFGRASLDNPRSPVAGIAVPQRIAQSSEITSWTSNLAASAERLDDILVATDILREKVRADAKGKDLQRLKEDSAAAEALAGLFRLAYDNLRIQQQNLRQFTAALDAWGAAGSAIANDVVPSQLNAVLLEGTTFGSYETRARWHISQDFGVLFGWHPNDVRVSEPYAGVNVYFSPVNKNAHVAPWCVFNSLLKCASVTLGVTMSNVTETNRFKGVFGGKAAVIGVGTRVGDFLRVSYLRPIVYSSSESQPRRQRVAALHAVSISIDAELKELLGAVGKSLFP